MSRRPQWPQNRASGLISLLHLRQRTIAPDPHEPARNGRVSPRHARCPLRATIELGERGGNNRLIFCPPVAAGATCLRHETRAMVRLHAAGVAEGEGPRTRSPDGPVRGRGPRRGSVSAAVAGGRLLPKRPAEPRTRSPRPRPAPPRQPRIPSVHRLFRTRKTTERRPSIGALFGRASERAMTRAMRGPAAPGALRSCLLPESSGFSWFQHGEQLTNGYSLAGQRVEPVALHRQG